MLLSSASSLTLVLLGVGGACIAGLIVIVGTRLLASAHKADAHLAVGMALTPRLPLAASNAPVDNAERTESVAALTPRTTQVAQSGGLDDASQQIFAQLNEYYAANISQGNTIFWASLLSMCIGFAIIFVGVISAGTNGITAIVAAIAGVLSQFIAATFLVVLRSTQQQATAYAQSLVELHLRDVGRTADKAAVALGLLLLREISGDHTDPANATKAAIAMGLIVKPSSTIVEPPAVTVEPPTAGEHNAERRRSGTVIFDDAGAAERR